MKMLSKTVKIAMFAPFAWIALVPLTILSFTRFSSASLGEARLYLGLAFIVIGASFCAAVGILFARSPHFGKSTLFRDSPDLVVSGPFAYVRNPMPLGVLMVIAGEAFLFGSVWVGAWGVVFFCRRAFLFEARRRAVACVAFRARLFGVLQKRSAMVSSRHAVEAVDFAVADGFARCRIQRARAAIISRPCFADAPTHAFAVASTRGNCPPICLRRKFFSRCRGAFRRP